MEIRTSTRTNAAIWFSAAVSLAEIMTGTYYAGMGLKRGIAAILLGHLIGGVLMLLAGLIGGRERQSAMECVKLSFGRDGARFFAVLNVVQLLGWTAIMCYDGALAAQEILAIGSRSWALIIGLLITVWIIVGLERLRWLSTLSMGALLLLSVLLSISIFRSGAYSGAETLSEAMSFGAAVELSIAMPLSWLPLISDYTREAEKPTEASLASVLVYSLVSVCMYLIGMAAAAHTGESSIAAVCLKAGLGGAGLLIIVLSTVTTGFLDAFSAGVSAETVLGGLKTKPMGIIAALVGTAGAVLFPMDDISGFLYLIGSVFAPMAAIQITDYFILKKVCISRISNKNFLIWLAGFISYRIMLGHDTPLGSTVPAMLISMLLTVLLRGLPDRLIGFAGKQSVV